MATVHVVDVRDGNTLAVSPPWRLGTQQGNLVRVKGMRLSPLSAPGGQLARYKLTLLLLGAVVQIVNTEGIHDDALVCEVVYQGQSLLTHFPEYVEEPVHVADRQKEREPQQAPL